MITWDQATFNRFYRHPDGFGYSRAWYANFAPGRQWWRDLYEQRIVPVFGTITGAQRILIVGCGMGMLVEGIRDSGFASVWGIDMGPYAPTLWPTETRSDILPLLLQADVRTVTSNQLRTLSNGTTFDWVITESMIESYAPAEQSAIYTACEALLTRNTPLSHVVHLVWPGWDGTVEGRTGCPPRTLAEWQASRSLHTFLTMEGI